VQVAGVKWLPATRLAQLLNELPAGAIVSVNAVGNLKIADEELRYIGYVDFLADGQTIIFNDKEHA